MICWGSPIGRGDLFRANMLWVRIPSPVPRFKQCWPNSWALAFQAGSSGSVTHTLLQVYAKMVEWKDTVASEATENLASSRVGSNPALSTRN